jgi:hypothetical protein
MLSSEYAEDLFVDFYKFVAQQKISIQGQDFSPISSFHEKINNNQELTKNQANFLLKLLDKYKNISANAGLDYRSVLGQLKWRNSFRVLDLTKRIYVESRQGKLEICLKFPYQLKKEFEEEINFNQNDSYKICQWDPEAKVRRLDLYDFNLIALYEFAIKHNFEIDDSFMSVVADIEEIWQNAEEVIPHSKLGVSGVTLTNISSETLEWWEHHKSNNIHQDLLLAKSMGFLYGEKPKNWVEKIASSAENSFWIKHNLDLLSVYKTITGKICIILDRTSNTLSWLQQFVADADRAEVNRDEIKVCFRENKENNSGINEWIKNAGVGGKVEEGRILIFESKPAKWLFKQDNDVIILVTNNIYPPTNMLAKDWFQCHPCVIYLGNTKPTETKGQKIVEL